MNHTGIKEVRRHNSDSFIKDFKRLRSFVVMTKGGEFYEVRKMDVWSAAKRGPIQYILTDELYVRKHTSMILI